MNRREALRLFGTGLAAVATSGCASSLRWLFEEPPASQRSDYRLPTEDDLRQKNLVYLLLDLEYEFGRNGAIPTARNRGTREAYTNAFESISTAFGRASGLRWSRGEDDGRLTREIETEPNRLLFTLDGAIRSNGFQAPPQTELPQGFVAARDIVGIDYLTEAFNLHYVDCDMYSFLALGVAERYGLPLYGVHSPRHFFTRLVVDDAHINFDQGNIISDEAYIDGTFVRSARQIPLASLQRQTYMKTLSKRETVAEHLATIAGGLSAHGEHAASLAVTELVIRWMPQSEKGHFYRGLTFTHLALFREADREYAIVNQLDPDLLRLIATGMER